MRYLELRAAIGTTILLLSSACEAKHGHEHSLSHLDFLEKRHQHKRLHTSQRVEDLGESLQKRGTCAFPNGVGLVPVTPGSQNAGWAMSPDQPCTPGNYCPYACPPGQLMNQWNPLATSYTYPLSMDGGLYCDSNGEISKPFPNQPYCVSGTGSIGAQNTYGSTVSFCQTVLPGNEAMLIPTAVDSWSQLAVPGTSYWCSTAAHYYVNPPGVGVVDACVWSDGSKPIGNWAPYVAGANTDANGNTFTKIGWNPIWTSSGLSSTPPTYGIKIVCSGSGCNGTPCSIDPSTNGVGGVTSSDQASGAGGANFCVVTVPPGETANIVVFKAGNSNSGSGSAGTTSESTPPVVSTTSTSIATSATIKLVTSSTTHSTSTTSTVLQPTTGTTTNTTTTAYPTADNSPHILFENSNTTSTVASASTGKSSTTASPSPIASVTKVSAAAGSFVSGAVVIFGVVLAAVTGFLI